MKVDKKRQSSFQNSSSSRGKCHDRKGNQTKFKHTTEQGVRQDRNSSHRLSCLKTGGRPVWNAVSQTQGSPWYIGHTRSFDTTPAATAINLSASPAFWEWLGRLLVPIYYFISLIMSSHVTWLHLFVTVQCFLCGQPTRLWIMVSYYRKKSAKEKAIGTQETHIHFLKIIWTYKNRILLNILYQATHPWDLQGNFLPLGFILCQSLCLS